MRIKCNDDQLMKFLNGNMTIVAKCLIWKHDDSLILQEEHNIDLGKLESNREITVRCPGMILDTWLNLRCFSSLPESHIRTVSSWKSNR